ncbi:sensor histidine kinase [Virgibacillus flavescens]|uniref:sensor histidine kinase n=1 Tax=Virgibacillus flavescens TaxID=1611422 RepID=UPI003D33FC64
MSIRKRLFFSNAAMIIMPVIIILFLVFLVKVVFSGTSQFNLQQHWQNADASTSELYETLIKTASLQQKKLRDEAYLDSLSNQLDPAHATLYIRKKEKIIYASSNANDISATDLPAFGNEGNNQAGVNSQRTHSSVRQHDFYFQDGSEGSILLLNDSASFVKFARTFFPIIFISLIVLLVLTNLLLSYFMSRSILRPVKQLSIASSKISNGDLDFTIKAKGKDELGRLVTTFDSMRQQLKESLALRDRYENNRRELIMNISHDLKTPVTSILGYAEGINDGVANSKEKQERYLQTIHAKATYMNRLIDELALYSKLDVKKLEFDFEAVDIISFVQDYIEEIREELSEKGIQLSLDTIEINENVLMDRDKVIRAMENVIYNSVKYMDKSDGRISISLIDQKQMIRLTVHDNGPGLSNDELPKIFSRFYRSDPARSKGGSGLGLAIASQIIEAHGGEIWAENGPDGGLMVHLTLKKAEDDEHE